MYFLYTLGLLAFFVLSLPWFLWKDRATGKYRRTFRERLGRLPASIDTHGQPSIWIHAVSVGEVLAAAPLILALRERLPGLPVFLSTTTVTGYAVAVSNASEADRLFFAPFDWPGPVRRVLDRLSPRLLVLVETELWPNLIHEARRRGTRVAIVNGRISPRSFPRYRRIRVLLRQVLDEVDLFLMQGGAHAARVKEMGAPAERVRVAGNLKFDALPEPTVPVEMRAVLETHRPLWIAGSTVGGEEEAVLEAFRLVRLTEPAATLMLVPRHPERFGAVAALVEAAGFGCVRRSLLAPGQWSGEEVVVLDTLGELARAYPLATAVFVGGSLVPAGGHNILEAAVAGKAVIVGPHMENFQEIADQFDEAGALVRVSDAAELAAEVSSLLKDGARREQLGRRGRALIGVHQGALSRTTDALVELLK